MADSGIRGLAGRLSLDKGLRHDPRDGRRQPALQRGRIGLGTIKEVDEIEWPVCAAHGDDRMARASDGEEPVALSDDFLFDGPSRSSTACRGGGVSARDMRLPR